MMTVNIALKEAASAAGPLIRDDKKHFSLNFLFPRLERPLKGLSPNGHDQQQPSVIASVVHVVPREPQFDPVDCSAISRSATDAIRSASQSASQAVQQATQSASQAIQQATISATNAIRDAQNQASQSVAQASRSSSSISSSASSAISFMQSSADQAISSAMNQARSVVAQASAAIAAAKGSNAVAGSSILSGVAKPTACPNNSNASVQATSTLTISPTQAALAIVGSIFASTLFVFFLWFLVSQHRRNATARNLQSAKKSRRPSWRSSSFDSGYSIDKPAMQFDMPAYDEDKARSTQNQYSSSSKVPSRERTGGAHPPFNLVPKPATTINVPSPQIRETSVTWDPKAPPKVPKFGNWLNLQRPVSPFGSIKLPVHDQPGEGPLGGQLKSPLFSSNAPTLMNNAPPSIADTTQESSQDFFKPPPSVQLKPKSPATPNRYSIMPPPVSMSAASVQATLRLKDRNRSRRRRSVADFIEDETKERYKQVKASVWNDGSASELSDSGGRSPPRERLRSDRGGDRSKSNERDVRKQIAGGNSDAIRTTEIEVFGRDPEMGRIREEIKTPDTVVSRSARVETAVRGRVLVPSMVNDMRGRSRLRFQDS